MISYPYHIISCHVLLCDIISYHTYCVISCDIPLARIMSYHVMSCLIMSHFDKCNCDCNLRIHACCAMLLFVMSCFQSDGRPPSVPFSCYIHVSCMCCAHSGSAHAYIHFLNSRSSPPQSHIPMSCIDLPSHPSIMSFLRCPFPPHVNSRS